jgi:serine/threonine-protein kinase HipA
VSQHALSIRGKRTNILKEDLLVMAEEMNIKNAEGILDKINDVVFRWDEYAKRAGVGASLTDSIAQTFLRLV